MPTISSPHWKFVLDLCTKHHLHLPCADCLSTQDKDIRVELVLKDMKVLRCNKNVRLKDFFPPEPDDWMYHRMIN